MPRGVFVKYSDHNPPKKINKRAKRIYDILKSCGYAVRSLQYRHGTHLIKGVGYATGIWLLCVKEPLDVRYCHHYGHLTNDGVLILDENDKHLTKK